MKLCRKYRLDAKMLMLLLLILFTGSVYTGGNTKNVKDFKEIKNFKYKPGILCHVEIVNINKKMPADVGAQIAQIQQDDATWKTKIKELFQPVDNAKNYLDALSFGVLIAFTALIGVFGASAIAATITLASIAIPLISIAGLVVGAFLTYKDAKARRAMVMEINSARKTIIDQVNSRFGAMEEYIDQSTMALEKSMLQGEFAQMHAYLSDCLDTGNKKKRNNCLVDRCSYVKAGFYKFAIYYEDVVKGIGAYETFSKLQLRRVQSNLILFETYVKSLLVPCETIHYIDKIRTVKEGTKEDAKDAKDDINELIQKGAVKVKAGVNNWLVKDRVINYMEKAHRLIIHAYKKGVDDLSKEARVLESTVDVIEEGKTQNMDIKCRFRMNMLNFDKCDYRKIVPKKEWEDALTKGLKNKWYASEGEFLNVYCVDESKYHDKPDYQTSIEQDLAPWYGNRLKTMNELLTSFDEKLKEEMVKATTVVT